MINFDINWYWIIQIKFFFENWSNHYIVHICIQCLIRMFLIDIWNKIAICFHVLVIIRGQRQTSIVIVLVKWATAWRELPLPETSFLLINNIQLVEPSNIRKSVFHFSHCYRPLLMTCFYSKVTSLKYATWKYWMNIGGFKCKLGNRFLYIDGYSIKLIDTNQTHIFSVSCRAAVCMYIQIELHYSTVKIIIQCHQLCVRQSVLNKKKSLSCQNFMLVVNYLIWI